MRAIVSFAGIGVLLFVIAAPAQDQVKPGPEHAKLKETVGTWDAVVLSNGKESKAVMTAKMGLGNLWLIEDFQGEVEGMKFEGHGMTTYDAQKKKYVNIWIDSMSTGHMISEGTIDKNNTMVLKGKMPTPEGGVVDCTLTTVHKDPNTMVLTVEGAGPDGKTMEFLKATYKKRTK